MAEPIARTHEHIAHLNGFGQGDAAELIARQLQAEKLLLSADEYGFAVGADE